MAGKRSTIQVRTLRTIELVQKGHDHAVLTDDDGLRDTCSSLLSAVLAHDIRNENVRLRRDPHEQQIHELNELVKQEQGT